MKLEVSNIYSGFRVLQAEFIQEVNSDVYIMEHEHSGARLLYLANEDDNKVFSISFRTPPADDSGVAHILEHSSLCGSRKYHLKEPFVELVKGSMNTFLNAMTFPDKTMYPVASRNSKDFRNLMDVYLDAVFYPLIYENKYTLKQEGWHYSLNSADDDLAYNGVVYNEMKGVYSSPDALLENEAMKALFPDTPYRFESGGHPDAIPQLTQSAFEEFHKTYYSPENSFIYLYGDMDIAETLQYLNDEYLSAFAKTGLVQSEIQMQEPFMRTKEVEAFYPVDDNEETAGKTYHELSIVTGCAKDIKTSMALRLLEGVLLESESSPLRRALVEAKVGQNISGSFVGSMLQPVFSIKVSGSEPEAKDKFISVIYKTLQNLTINGLDKKLLEAALNSLEFKLREADFGAYPKGLIYGIGVMDNWLYGGNPIDGLRCFDILKELREGIDKRYYESLIENYLLDNTHKVIVTLLPEKGKEAKDHAAEKERMAAVKTAMTAEDLQRYIDECRELHRLQELPDSAEDLASIPILKRTDIRQEVEKFALQEELAGKNKILYLPASANNISYLNWYFDMSGIESKFLPYCFLLTDVLGKFNTKRYTYEEISTDSIMYTGGISFAVKAVSAAENADKYRIYFTVKAKTLVKNLAKTMDILKAVATESVFSDLERFKDLVGEIKSDWDDNFFNRGQNIAITRLCSYTSAAARANEQDQLSYYQFIKDLADNFAEKGNTALQALKMLMPVFFQKSNYIFAYSCDTENSSEVKNAAMSFIEALPETELKTFAIDVIDTYQTNEAVTTAGKVQYVAAGGNFVQHGHKFTGAMRVLETILRYEYLWTKIRIQGGAYGATAKFDRNGLTAFASYRDPKLKESLDAYNGLPDWLSEADFSERELDKYVIGTISGMDVPLTNSMRLDQALAAYIKDVTDEMRQQTRDEVLQVTNDDLRKLAVVIKDLLSDGLICVVGGKQSIEQNKELFNNIINV